MEKIIRSSKHYISETNIGKVNLLKEVLSRAKTISQVYIDMMLKNELPIMNQLSSKKLPSVNGMDGGQWKQLIYANASSVVRSNIKSTRDRTFKRYKRVYTYFKEKGRQTKFISKRYSELNIDYKKRMDINLSNFGINIDERMCDLQKGNHFDYFLELKTFFIKDGFKNKRIGVRVPVKEHEHSLLFKEWERKKSFRLSLDEQDRIYIAFTYETDLPVKNKNGISLGLDCGYKKLLSDSNGNHYGVEMEELYKQLANKQRGSKNYQQLLTHKNNEVNRIINSLPLDNVENLIVEDLKNVKHKSKLSGKFNNKLQYWVYSRVLSRLDLVSQIKGFNLIKVNPSYTSQICSNCSTLDKSNRQGEIYHCSSCGIIMDADTNGAVNILRRGVYSPSSKET